MERGGTKIAGGYLTDENQQTGDRFNFADAELLVKKKGDSYYML